jgi:GWxTD domain-containing protein
MLIMSKKRTILAAILFLGLAVAAPPRVPGVQVKEKDLPQKYREWLKLVSYIILPAERDVFSHLTADRDRDIFVEAFWKQRDPTPGTPQNEFQEEQTKRFNYANEYLRRGTPREGWMTDMGQMYIILGEPSSRERFDGVPGVYPCQVWYYYGDRTKGLPTYFGLLFYQRGGAGEYRLYNPTVDGPSSLIIDAKGLDVTNFRSLYEKIYELAPTLAPVVLSIIPGQIPYNYTPSPQTNIILADIQASPKKSINAAYATHFLRYKGIVSTEYLTNFVESAVALALVKDPVLGIHFCHLALSPKKISVDYFKPRDQYYCNFKLDVSLRAGEQIIFQYSKDFPFYFPPDKLANIEANGVTIEDSFPVIEGQYGLTVLLQNAVGREFTVSEKEIVVGSLAEHPQIIGPILGYDLQDSASPLHTPFKFLNKQLQVDPNATFSVRDKIAFFLSLVNLTEDVWRDGEMAVLIKGLREKEPRSKSLAIKLAAYPFQKTLGLAESVSAEELAPDYYEISFLLKDGKGETVAEARSQFIISPQDILPHPVTIAKNFPLVNSYLFYSAVASQYEQVGRTAEAEASFEKALNLNPNFREGLVAYAEFLLKTGRPDRALEVIERLKAEVSARFDYFLIKGRALEAKGEYQAAIESLLQGNKLYDSDTRLLNSLGNCFYKRGQKKEALEALNASLRLNPEQKAVQELAARVEKELK